MINLKETIQKGLALMNQVKTTKKKVNCRLGIKSAVTELIEVILEIMFEFMFFKMAERHSEPA